MTATKHLLSAFEVELVADQHDVGTMDLAGHTYAVVRKPNGEHVVYTDAPVVPSQREPGAGS